MSNKRCPKCDSKETEFELESYVIRCKKCSFRWDVRDHHKLMDKG